MIMEMNSSSMAAAGFKFAPTDEELITLFLFRKCMGWPMPDYNPVAEIDLYGDKHPMDALSDIIDCPYWNTTKDKQKEMYAFTRLSKVSSGKTRVSRTTAHGTWHGQTGGKNIQLSATGELIGNKKMLSFTDENKRWIMHEFSLDGVLLKHDLKHRDYVVCKITTKDLSKKRPYVEEKGDSRGLTACCKKQKTNPDDHTLSVDDYGNMDDDAEFASMLENMLDVELESCGNNVVVVSDQECNNLPDHNNDDQLKGGNGNSSTVLFNGVIECIDQDSAIDWSILDDEHFIDYDVLLDLDRRVECIDPDSAILPFIDHTDNQVCNNGPIS